MLCHVNFALLHKLFCLPFHSCSSAGWLAVPGCSALKFGLYIADRCTWYSLVCLCSVVLEKLFSVLSAKDDDSLVWHNFSSALSSTGIVLQEMKTLSVTWNRMKIAYKWMT